MSATRRHTAAPRKAAGLTDNPKEKGVVAVNTWKATVGLMIRAILCLPAQASGAKKKIIMRYSHSSGSHGGGAPPRSGSGLQKIR